MANQRILIVGGVAGGASCAARARRLSETAEIILFERGPYVSFANCGLPYYVGNVIKKQAHLLVATPKRFKQWFDIDVRPGANVREIIPATRTIVVADQATGREYRESYDTLVLSPGSQPLKPPIEGIDLPGIFTLRTIPDTLAIKDWVDNQQGQSRSQLPHAVVVGGGFIGLEMAENLAARGLQVTIVEMQPHVMPAMDMEMAAFIHDHLRAKNISLELGSPVASFGRGQDGTLNVNTAAGRTLAADLVLLAIGVRPEIELAGRAGLKLGDLGGIRVDEFMRTSDPHIFAVGDAVEVNDYLTQTPALVPLAGPANRQGRLAADVIAGADSDPSNIDLEFKAEPFRGVQATAVCGIMGLTVASTGSTEKALKRRATATETPQYEKVYLFPNHHAGYYPGAKTIALKLMFNPRDGRILGAQAVGTEGVDKRIDVIAMAIQTGATVFDLAQAELCYAPQYGSAKDPVNMAGMIAANVVQGLCPTTHWEQLCGENLNGMPLILDVRELKEYQKQHVEGAFHIPLGQVRERLGELPRGREIWVHCAGGQRSYFATRILNQNGFQAYNLSGGFTLYQAVKQFKPLP